MPLDANVLLRDGSTADLAESESAPTSTTINADGALVYDMRKTAYGGIVAVLNCPAAPTAFADTLIVLVQVSDHIATDFKTIATFPTLYALNRRLRVTSTTAFVTSDIGTTLTGTTTSDAGVIRWYDKALETVGGVGDVIVSQVAADSDFDNASEAFTTSGTGAGTMNKASELTEYLSYGNYAMRFSSNKRYVRGQLTVTTGGGWGATILALTNHWPLGSSQ